jgi:hypothetical protein
VQFISDEMANMVWAIEQRLASRLGEGVLQSSGPLPRTGGGNAVRARNVGARQLTPIHPGAPFPVRCAASACSAPGCGFPREPKAEVLRVEGSYFIEEEVPRAGRLVQRVFQRTCWHNGSTFLWRGCRSQIGRGEGSSGLAFDHVL